MKHDARGFTLVEVLVAMLLLSLGVLAVAPMFVSAVAQSAADGDSGVVGAIAVERMELLRALPYSGLDAGGSLTGNVAVSGVDYFDLATTGYVIRWQIADNATGIGGKRIDVRAMAISSPLGAPSEITLSSIRVGE